MREERALGNRRAAGAGQLRSAPGHQSESPTGYSSAGCSPAEPASASPVTDNSSSIPIRRGNQMRRSTSLQGYRPAFGCDALSRRSCLPPTGCHLYFAHRVTFLSCADTHLNAEGALDRLRLSSEIEGGDIAAGGAKLDRLRLAAHVADLSEPKAVLDGSFRAYGLDGTLALAAELKGNSELVLPQLRISAADSAVEGSLRVALD